MKIFGVGGANPRHLQFKFLVLGRLAMRQVDSIMKVNSPLKMCLRGGGWGCCYILAAL
jgi:hypothetical protein